MQQGKPTVEINRISTNSEGATRTVFTRQAVQQPQNFVPTQADRSISIQQAAQHVDMQQAISIDLPSKFKFYTFKDLYVKPLRNIHRAKLAAAYSQKSIRPVVEVIDSLLSTSSGLTGLAYLLTEPDFTYVMYWIRLHFFMSVPFTIKTQCKNPDHIAQVKAGKKNKATLNIVQTLNNLVPESKSLPDSYTPNFSKYIPSFAGVANPPSEFYVSVPTYSDIMELTEDEEFIIDQKDPTTGKVEKTFNAAFIYLVNAAAFLHIPGMSLRERAALVGEMDEEDYNKLIEASKTIPEYGINEIVSVRCKDCGAVRQVRVRLDAHSFFPNL